MSYILEALKKAEQQRELGHVPGIGSVHEEAAPRTFTRWPWLLGGILALNILLLLLIWPQPAAENSADSQPLVQSPPQAGPLPEPQPRVPEMSAPAPYQPPSVEPVAKYRPPAVEPVAKYRPSATEPVVPQYQPPVPVVEREASRPVPQTSVAEPVPVRVPEPVEYKPVLPVWPQIPANLFRQLSGGLRLDVHVYSAQAGDRFVLINLRKYYQGEQLQEGPLLDEITPEGVILSFRGEKFRMQAQ